jgi:hypothetical protein
MLAQLQRGVLQVSAADMLKTQLTAEERSHVQSDASVARAERMLLQLFAHHGHVRTQAGRPRVPLPCLPRTAAAIVRTLRCSNCRGARLAD